ncbi:TIGR02556 family CRISPR-associated protein [Methanococcus voltae]|uniref:CRISPR-associated protein, TM1802 family n=1 Tax=Methanococcus voltae (strain ATCC BAA-1334 / A3) TaxID=456320 RepID=D7DSS4_METV3|nr:TIGR02556 family CRISPR-associated protein [Methanococcus voltae]MCS3901785.1 CRISPR-associated protein Csh1 [Methanococcus voltae]
MLEHIANIGKYSDESGQLIDLWQKDEKDFDGIIEVAITNGKVDNILAKQFDKKVWRNMLFYQVGNGFVGSLVKIEKFKDDKKIIEKLKKKVEKSIKFLDLKFNNNQIDGLMKEIVSQIQDTSKNYVVSFKINDKYPFEIGSLNDKFNLEIEKTYLNKSKVKKKCHICSKEDIAYNTAVYKCYTNDKCIFSNTEDGESFFMCRDCVINILKGRKFIDNNLKGYWIGNEVMFLPQNVNEDVLEAFEEFVIYDKSDIERKNPQKLINSIKNNENEVFTSLGNLKTPLDIIFFDDPKASSEWKIRYSINGVLPSRFTIISKLEQKYMNKKGSELNLWMVINYLIPRDDKNKYSSNEAKSILNVIFQGNKYSRNLFFAKVMQKYKAEYGKYLKKEIKYPPNINDIHRIYNFMVDCGCLSKGWNFAYELSNRPFNKENNEDNNMLYESIVKYESINELFDKNKDYFDTDTKKAWFLLGNIYDSIVYYSKKYHNSDKSYLESNFYYGNKFDEKFFQKMLNQCNELMLKYGTTIQGKVGLEKRITDAKYLMTDKNNDKNNKLSSDEAKYIFFWGLQQYFGPIKKDEKEE